MRAVLTGHTGFLGSYLHASLAEKYTVVSISRNGSGDICCDLARSVPLIDMRPDLVVHNAGMAHFVPKKMEDSDGFFKVNYSGTVNLCRGLEAVGAPRRFIFISTVAVYGLEIGSLIDEGFDLKGKTPYAKSKIKAEDFLKKWCVENNVRLTILRLPLVVGLNPPGNLGAMIRAIKRGYYMSLPTAAAVRRSAVWAGDVADLITEDLKEGVFNLGDGIHPSINDFEKAVAFHFNKSLPMTIPSWFLRFVAFWGDLLSLIPFNSYRFSKLSNSLTFDDSLARKELGWRSHSAVGSMFK